MLKLKNLKGILSVFIGVYLRFKKKYFVCGWCGILIVYFWETADISR